MRLELHELHVHNYVVLSSLSLFMIADVPDFFLIGLHSKPTDTVSELNQLVEVYNNAATYFGTESGLILGDLNADCTYLSRTRYEQLELVTDPRFTWLINTTADTTTISTTNCAYDRWGLGGRGGGKWVWEEESGLAEEGGRVREEVGEG